MSNYYRAVELADGFQGQIYTYDATGNKERLVWVTFGTYPTPEAAEDAVCVYADNNNIELEGPPK